MNTTTTLPQFDRNQLANLIQTHHAECYAREPRKLLATLGLYRDHYNSQTTAHLKIGIVNVVVTVKECNSAAQSKALQQAIKKMEITIRGASFLSWEELLEAIGNKQTKSGVFLTINTYK